MLVGVKTKHPGELRNDLQRFYGLNLDDMGFRYRPSHIANMLPFFPPEGAVAKAYEPNLAWDTKTHLLASILDAQNLWLWANSKDGKKNRNRPAPIPRPNNLGKETRGVEVAELERLLALPRTAVKE